MKDLINHIDNAILEAIYTFTKNEGKYCLKIREAYDEYKSKNSSKIIDDYEKDFTEFATTFKVGRNIPEGNKREILKLIFNKFLPALEGKKDFMAVQGFAECLKAKKLSHNTKNGNNQLLLSLISKVAFIFKPEYYNPYDSFVKLAIKKHFKENVDKDYIRYSELIEKFINDQTSQLNLEKCVKTESYLNNRDSLINSIFKRLKQNFNKTCNQLNISDNDKFLVKRTTDKLLMIHGDFSPDKLEIQKIFKLLGS